MLIYNDVQKLRTPGQRLLQAVGIGPSLEGSCLAARLIRSCTNSAQALWPQSAIEEWHQEAIQLNTNLESLHARDREKNASWNQLTERVEPIAIAFLKWSAPILDVGFEAELHGLVGRAIIAAAAANHRVHIDLLSGLTTTRLAHLRKGKRSSDWEQFLAVNLASSEALADLRKRFPSHSPCQPFLDQLIGLAGTAIPGIAFLEGDHTKPLLSTPDCNAGSFEANTGGFETSSTSIPPTAEGSRALDPTPDIGRRLASADFAGFAQKLGLHHRDRLILEDLALVTHRIATHLQDGGRLEQGYAILALTSLITGCTDFVALNLEFEYRNTIWLSLQNGCWAWDFRYYRQSNQDTSKHPEPEPVFVPLPHRLFAKLQSAKNTAPPSAAKLEEVLASWQGVESFDLRAFRVFLKACGDSAHPAYRARFAVSLAGAYLEITGSDMAAGLLTGQFAATAPAALYYFGPSWPRVITYANRVYAELGLGEATSLIEAASIGCSKILPIAELQAGWGQLVDDIHAIADDLQSTQTDAEFADAFNHLMVKLCTAFVIGAAHRGTRFDCLTFGALFLCPAALLIHDKDDGETHRAQPRLIPRTSILAAILHMANWCHLQLQSRITPTTSNNAHATDAPVFVNLGIDWPTTEASVCVSTAQVRAQTSKYFSGSEHNFGRSQWITNLDEDACSRWLIRFLTGHTRDVTRTNGAYMDVPPLAAVRELKQQMETTGLRMLGSSMACIHGELPTMALTFSTRDKDVFGPSYRMPDVRNILPPLSTATLMGWQITTKLRASLSAGLLGGSASALAALHLIFMDLIPDPESSISAVINPADSIKSVGIKDGFLWERPHFTHPTWIPIQSSTSTLISKCTGVKTSRNSLVSEVCAIVRAPSPASWPTDDQECWTAISLAALSFRRLEMPPTLCAISLPSVPAPTLSVLSIWRLSNPAQNTEPIPPTSSTPRTHERRSSKADDLNALQQCLAANMSQAERLGERRARAKNCMKDISQISTQFTPPAVWLKDWIQDELTRSHALAKNSYALSSLHTYLTTLLLSVNQLPPGTDPYEWEESDWLHFAKVLNSKCSPNKNLPAASSMQLFDRAKHAISAIAWSLIRRQEYVPASLMEMIGLERTPSRHGSASATIILHADVEQSVQQFWQIHENSPLDALQLEVRAVLGSYVPMRSSEGSSLYTDFLTRGGGCVFERAGYDTHKNDNAIRVTKLSNDRLQRLASLIQRIKSYQGDKELLLRGNGSLVAGLRDAEHISEFSSTLKFVTGDPAARPHSLRAAALQEIAWPGWQVIARRFLNLQVSTNEIIDWLTNLQSDWTRTASAAATAGHGSLASAFGNYLAGWALIYGIHVAALTKNLTPAPNFLAQLEVDPAAMRKSRQRWRSNTAVADIAPAKFDDWHWLEGHLRMRHQKVKPQSSSEALSAGPKASLSARPSPKHQSKLDLSAGVLYLSLRVLGDEPGMALEESKVGLNHQIELEKLMPSSRLIDATTRRARSPVQPRGQTANLEMAQSELGRQIISWQLSLTCCDQTTYRAALFGEESPLVNFDGTSQTFWLRTIENLPLQLCLQIQRGARHVCSDEVKFFAMSHGRLTLSGNPQIGAKPILSLGLLNDTNRVKSARLSTVLKAIVLSISSITTNLPGGNKCQ